MSREIPPRFQKMFQRRDWRQTPSLQLQAAKDKRCTSTLFPFFFSFFGVICIAFASGKRGSGRQKFERMLLTKPIEPKPEELADLRSEDEGPLNRTFDVPPEDSYLEKNRANVEQKEKDEAAESADEGQLSNVLLVEGEWKWVFVSEAPMDDADEFWSLDELPPANFDDYFYSFLGGDGDRAAQKRAETSKTLLPPGYFSATSDSGLESLSGGSTRPDLLVDCRLPKFQDDFPLDAVALDQSFCSEAPPPSAFTSRCGSLLRRPRKSRLAARFSSPSLEE